MNKSNPKPKEIKYEDKLKLAEERFQEFISCIEVADAIDRKSNTSLSKIIEELDMQSEKYFSIEYFYNGLNNCDGIKAGNQGNIHFMFWVLASMLYEMFLKYSDDNIFDYFGQLYFSKYFYKIQTKNIRTTQIVLEFTEQERYFITGKLPYLINEYKIREIKSTIDKPDNQFRKMCSSLSSKEKEIESKLSSYQQRAEEIGNFIKEQNTKLNFVGLGSAFQSMSNEKRSAKNWIFIALIILFLGLLGIPLLTYKEIYRVETPNYYMAIPFTVIEFVLLYVFRLFYQQYLFVKSELLQVNLRHNLCAFIEDYMEFKKDNKDNTVDLFEQLIFSNIISDEKKVPATVDGLDSVANIIKAFKEK